MTSSGSLCSGVGGLDLAIEAVFDAETVWQAEVDPHASTVLEKRWPGVPNLGDITAVDWSKVEPVDVLSGGTPCQDMSSAGRRAGMRPGTRSGLWSAMAEAIYHLRPSVVVWENVEGALSACAHSDLEPCPGCVGDGPHEPVLRAPGRVLGDLADLGFDAEWTVVPASGVGACHRRRRLFVVAVAADAHDRALDWQRPRPEPRSGGPGDDRGVGDLLPTPEVADGTGGRRATNLEWRGGTAYRPSGAKASVSLQEAIDLLPTPTAEEPGGTAEQYHARLAAHDGREATFLPLSMAVQLLPTVRTSDANGAGAHGDGGVDLRTAVGDLLPMVTLSDPVPFRLRWGRYAAAIARHERVFGRPAPSPTVEGRNGTAVLSHRFTEWMMGWPDGWVSDLLDRRPGLRCCGNGVVPAQAAAAISSLLAAFGTEVSR